MQRRQSFINALDPLAQDALDLLGIEEPEAPFNRRNVLRIIRESYDPTRRNRRDARRRGSQAIKKIKPYPHVAKYRKLVIKVLRAYYGADVIIDRQPRRLMPGPDLPVMKKPNGLTQG